MAKMNILIANDDGINASGLHALVQALSGEHNVYVAAPSGQRSASGHSITIGKPIQIQQIQMEQLKYAKKVLSISGTPADCVKLGLRYLGEHGVLIDIICSGINHGGNLGTDTLYSGTVAAAIEGALCGKPAVAVSVNSHEATYFEKACDLAVEAVDYLGRNMNNKLVLNINTPNLPKEEIKGVRFTRLGVREYEEWFHPRTNPDGEVEYWYQGTPVVYDSQNLDIDVIADQEGYATITPLQYNMTNFMELEKIKKGEIEK